jgi:hypothetical protein
MTSAVGRLTAAAVLLLLVLCEFHVLSKYTIYRSSCGCNTAITIQKTKDVRTKKTLQRLRTRRLPNVQFRNPVNPSSVDVRQTRGTSAAKRIQFASCTMRRCFGSWVASDVSKDRCAFIFQSKQSKPPKKTGSHPINLKSRSPKLGCHSWFFCIPWPMRPLVQLKRQESNAHHCFHLMHSSRLRGALLHISLHLPVLSFYLIAKHYFERPARIEYFPL